MLQTSFKRLASAAVPVLAELQTISEQRRARLLRGGEPRPRARALPRAAPFTFELSPFLHLASGATRIRIEHGHVYDPFFSRYPEALLVGHSPRRTGPLDPPADMYRGWTWLAERLDRVQRGEGRRRRRRDLRPPPGREDAARPRASMPAVRPHAQRRARGARRPAPT